MHEVETLAMEGGKVFLGIASDAARGATEMGEAIGQRGHGPRRYFGDEWRDQSRRVHFPASVELKSSSAAKGCTRRSHRQ